MTYPTLNKSNQFIGKFFIVYDSANRYAIASINGITGEQYLVSKFFPNLKEVKQDLKALRCTIKESN